MAADAIEVFPFILPTDPHAALDAFDHVAAGLDRLAQYIKGKPNAEGILTGMITQCQEVEQCLQELIFYRKLENAFGIHLDNLGAIVGQPRTGLVDDDYRKFIRAKIQVNISSGTTEDLYAAVAPLLPEDNTVTLVNEYPAGFAMSVIGEMPSVTALGMLKFVRTARGAGIRGIIIWSIYAPEETFTFDSGPGFDDPDSHFASAAA